MSLLAELNFLGLRFSEKHANRSTNKNPEKTLMSRVPSRLPFHYTEWAVIHGLSSAPIYIGYIVKFPTVIHGQNCSNDSWKSCTWEKKHLASAVFFVCHLCNVHLCAQFTKVIGANRVWWFFVCPAQPLGAVQLQRIQAKVKTTRLATKPVLVLKSAGVVRG